MENLRINKDGELTPARRGPELDSGYVEPHLRWTPYAGPVVWTGPDGNRDHRPRIFKDWHVVGIGETSPEKTLACTYISRALPNQPFPRGRGDGIGEIGWWYNNYDKPMAKSYQPFVPTR